MAELILMTVTAAGCETVAKVPLSEVGCQWFALCENEATTTQAHPILGDVPICERCKANYDALA